MIINVKFVVKQQQQSGTDGPSEGISEDLPAATTDDGSDLDDDDFDERDDGEVHSGDDDEEIIDVGDPGNTDCHNTNLGALAALGPPVPLGAVAPPTTTIAAPRPLLPGSLLQVWPRMHHFLVVFFSILSLRKEPTIVLKTTNDIA